LAPASTAFASTPNLGNPLPGGKCTEASPWIAKCTPAPWAGGERHVVTDGLSAPDGSVTMTGSVTFWCQSQVGFQYHIAVQGLAPRSSYTVRYVTQAEEPGSEIDPTGPSGVLGTMHTDAKGTGGLNGTLKLPSGFYSFAVQVVDGTGNVVLQPSLEDWGGVLVPDTNGFIVF
jgi:hypothetical protein